MIRGTESRDPNGIRLRCYSQSGNIHTLGDNKMLKPLMLVISLIAVAQFALSFAAETYDAARGTVVTVRCVNCPHCGTRQNIEVVRPTWRCSSCWKTSESPADAIPHLIGDKPQP
jgi:hypothetical protein